MIRTQIQLTESQLDRLRRKAAAGGVSMAAEIRIALERHLEDSGNGTSARQRAISAIGGFRSGKSDVAVNHDQYLGEAFGA